MKNTLRIELIVAVLGMGALPAHAIGSASCAVMIAAPSTSMTHAGKRRVRTVPAVPRRGSIRSVPARSDLSLYAGIASATAVVALALVEE